MCTCTPQTHIVEYKGGGAHVAQDVTSHKGPKNATKITYLGINRMRTGIGLNFSGAGNLMGI